MSDGQPDRPGASLAAVDDRVDHLAGEHRRRHGEDRADDAEGEEARPALAGAGGRSRRSGAASPRLKPRRGCSPCMALSSAIQWLKSICMPPSFTLQVRLRSRQAISGPRHTRTAARRHTGGPATRGARRESSHRHRRIRRRRRSRDAGAGAAGAGRHGHGGLRGRSASQPHRGDGVGLLGRDRQSPRRSTPTGPRSRTKPPPHCSERSTRSVPPLRSTRSSRSAAPGRSSAAWRATSRSTWWPSGPVATAPSGGPSSVR